MYLGLVVSLTGNMAKLRYFFYQKLVLSTWPKKNTGLILIKNKAIMKKVFLMLSMVANYGYAQYATFTPQVYQP